MIYTSNASLTLHSGQINVWRRQETKNTDFWTLIPSSRNQFRRYNTKDLEFDAVYASPLKRAAKTAEIATDGKHNIQFDDRLVERSFGDFEGKEINGWVEATGYDIGDLKLNTNVGNIEPVRDVPVRTKAFLDDVKTKHNDNDVILVVAHGQVARGFHHNLVGYTDDTDWWSVEYGNAEAREYEF